MIWEKKKGAECEERKGASMADGGFVVKINGKELCRCYSIAFDYDEWQYTVNDKKAKPLPAGTESISVEVES